MLTVLVILAIFTIVTAIVYVSSDIGEDLNRHKEKVAKARETVYRHNELKEQEQVDELPPV